MPKPKKTAALVLDPEAENQERYQRTLVAFRAWGRPSFTYEEFCVMQRKQKQGKPLRNGKRHAVHLADIAYRELQLNQCSWTQADNARLGRIWRGMVFLDEDQAELRGTFTELLVAWDKSKHSPKDVKALVEGLRKLAAPPEGLERVEVPGDDF